MPSTGSMTNSTLGPLPVPTFSLSAKAGALSLGPSQLITSPSMSVWASTAREKSTAFWSIRSQLPCPTWSAAPTAPATVIRVSEGANALRLTMVGFFLLCVVVVVVRVIKICAC